jgi:disulfide bond formation protein DsbB
LADSSSSATSSDHGPVSRRRALHSAGERRPARRRLFFQYVIGLAPCQLCLYQRWPYDAAIALALIAVIAGDRASAPVAIALCGALFAVGAGLAFYHVGVEQHWFAGPTACSGGPDADTVEALKQQIMGQKPVRCDEVPWALFGVSLAGWNLIASLALAAFSFVAFLRLRAGRAA